MIGQGQTKSRFLERGLFVVLTLGLMSPVRAGAPFTLVEHDVVVFAGGTNMVRGQQAGYLETILTRAFASSRPQFRDFAWEADTVFQQGSVSERWRTDGFGSHNEQLKRVGATVVIAQFGRLESLAGREGIEAFATAYAELIDAFQRQARLVVLVTPTPFETPPSRLVPDLSTRNADLALYVNRTAKIAKDRGLLFVDLFTTAKPDLTDNGMHVRNEVQAHVAQEIARQLGVDVGTDRSIGDRSLTGLEPLRQAVIEKHRLWYDYWRPANWKLLFGDDSQRQFTRGGEDYIPFREEWKQLAPLITQAEQRVWKIAGGGVDPGLSRPDPEVLHGDAAADIEQELAAFKTPEGLQVNLFASEREGLTSPLNIRWDPAGRMYVTVTTTYPHVFPGDVPNDKIIVLKDADGDGAADESSVFADGLNIPTGIELGDGGVYVGQNTEVLFLQDTDGDGRADTRRVILGGFGNGDSHQTINSFVWSPDGELFFGQGDGIESRVETPWGASDLYRSGFYRFRPRRLQLLPFLDDHKGPGNPWGVAFDPWGQAFSVDGAGGVTWLSPALAPTERGPGYRQIGRIGEPGGYCGIGFLDGRHLPESMHGDFVIGDYKANRIKRFSVTRSGGGFSLQWREPVLHSRHRSFRPVDVKVGPDGAIYVVDWYNPITCHQDDAYRDPTRDKAHGRIWRIAAERPAVRPPDLSTASLDEVVKSLGSPELWTRYQAKRALTVHELQAVAEALDSWVRSLDPTRPGYEHRLVEALAACATIEVVRPQLLDRLLAASDPRARAFATRIVGRWHDRLDRPLDLLADRIADEDELVRLEAVVACAAIAVPESIEVAARIINRPRDKWSGYAFEQTVRHLRKTWMPAFERGELSFERPSQLAAVLNVTGGRNLLGTLKQLVEAEELDAHARASLISAILAVGGPEELADYGLSSDQFHHSGEYDSAAHATVLGQLIEVAEIRAVRPPDDALAKLAELILSPQPELQAAGLSLAGIWQVPSTVELAVAAARDESLPLMVRAAAFDAIARMGLPESREILLAHSGETSSSGLRSAAIQSLAAVDAAVAARHAALLFADPQLPQTLYEPTLLAFLNRKEGPESLAAALATKSLTSETARRILRSLFAAGRSDQVLFDVLNRAIATSTLVPDYSEGYVSALVAEAAHQGNVKQGASIFKSMACVSCHKVGGAGGDVGPDLTAIGTTLSAERIVEELLWPNRQIKEGFSAVIVVTDSGKVHTGYERTTAESREADVLILEDPVSGTLITIKQQSVEQKKILGSVMPTGLTAVLSERQLLDLIQYLSELGRLR